MRSSWFGVAAYCFIGATLVHAERPAKIQSVNPARVEQKKQSVVYITGEHLDQVAGCTIQPVSAGDLTRFDGCTAKRVASKKQLVLTIQGALIQNPGNYVIELTNAPIVTGSDSGQTSYNGTNMKVLAVGRFYVFQSPGTPAGSAQSNNLPNPAPDGTIHPYTDCISQSDPSNPVSAQTVSPTSVLCGSSIVPDAEVSDEFGYHVSSLYSAIQVRVSNKNAQYDFLLRDIVLTLPDGRVISGRIRRFAQGIAVKGRTHDRRAIVFNSLTAAGGVYGALASFGSAGFTTAGNVLQGAFMASFNQIFPDYTADNVNRFNNAVFDDQNPSVVPKDSIGQPPLYVIALVPKEPGLDKNISYENAKNILVSIEGTFIKQVTLLSLSKTALNFAPEFISPPVFPTSTFDFHELQQYPQDLQQLTISNTGSTAMNIHSFKIVPSGSTSGANSADFVSDPSTSNCGIGGGSTKASDGTTAFTIAPNSSCVIAVRFQPTKVGQITSTLTFDGDNLEGATSVTLSGTGVGIVMQAMDSAKPASSHTFTCTYASLSTCNFSIGNQNNKAATVNVYYFTDPLAPDTLIANQVPTATATQFPSQAFPTSSANVLSSGKALSVPFPTSGSITTMQFSDSKLLKSPLTVNFVFQTVATTIDVTGVTNSIDADNMLKQNATLSVHVTSGGGVPTGTVTFTFTNVSTKSVSRLTPSLDTNGVATPDLSKLKPGTYSLVISYDGADTFLPFTVPDSTTVTIFPTKLAIGPKPSGAALNALVAIPVTASIPAGTCTGTLKAPVTLNGNTVASDVSSTGGGGWQVTFTPASAGTYSIAATYTPDGASVCTAATQTTTMSLP